MLLWSMALRRSALRSLPKGAERVSLTRLKQILLAAVLAVGFVVIPHAEAEAPKLSHEQRLLAMPPKLYALKLVKAEWGAGHFGCLAKLWGKESAWNPRAFNPIKVNGLNAGGIPQILGLDPAMPHTKQIDRGIKYIKHRYSNPCRAWAFWQKKGWY